MPVSMLSPWPHRRSAPRTPLVLGLLLLHGLLGLAWWQNTRMPKAVSLHPVALTWVSLRPEQPQARGSSSPVRRLPTPSSATPAAATPSVQPPQIIQPGVAAEGPATAVEARTASTSRATAVPSPGDGAEPNIGLARLPVTSTTPRELPSSALRYLVPPAQVYPVRSQRLGEQGTVWLRLVVSAEGQPTSVTVARSSGHARLDEQALQAMRAARFAPHIEHGQALEWTALAPLSYELE